MRVTPVTHLVSAYVKHRLEEGASSIEAFERGRDLFDAHFEGVRSHEVIPLSLRTQDPDRLCAGPS